MSENGFADVGDIALVEGGEGDVKVPTASFERSPLKVLQSLDARPLQQAIKAIEYIDSGRERERKFLKACSPAALNLIAQNGAEYLTAVQGVSA
jgi:hypothetical protein